MEKNVANKDPVHASATKARWTRSGSSKAARLPSRVLGFIGVIGLRRPERVYRV